MSVQIKKHTHSSTRTRRAHIRIKKQLLVSCTHCGETKKAHRLCNKCNKY